MNTWQHWVNFVLAIWLIVSGYVVTAAGMVTNLWIVGIVIGVLALWGALEGSSARAHRSSMA